MLGIVIRLVLLGAMFVVLSLVIEWVRDEIHTKIVLPRRFKTQGVKYQSTDFLSRTTNWIITLFAAAMSVGLFWWVRFLPDFTQLAVTRQGIRESLLGTYVLVGIAATFLLIMVVLAQAISFVANRTLPTFSHPLEHAFGKLTFAEKFAALIWLVSAIITLIALQWIELVQVPFMPQF